MIMAILGLVVIAFVGTVVWGVIAGMIERYQVEKQGQVTLIKPQKDEARELLIHESTDDVSEDISILQDESEMPVQQSKMVDDGVEEDNDDIIIPTITDGHVESTLENDPNYYTHMEPTGFMFADDYTVVDIETEGLNYKYDKIVELSAIRVRDNKIVDQFQVFNKDSKVTDFLLDNSPLTQTVIDEQGIEVKEMLKQFLDFLGDDDMVGHNIGFDLNFIRYNLHYYELGDLRNYYVDTMLIGKYFAHPNWKHHKVDNYVSRYPAKVGGTGLQQHTAINDVVIEKRIYDLEREKLGKDWTGQVTTDMSWSLPKVSIAETEKQKQERWRERTFNIAMNLSKIDKQYAASNELFLELLSDKGRRDKKTYNIIFRRMVINYKRLRDFESALSVLNDWEKQVDEIFTTSSDRKWIKENKGKLQDKLRIS
ncbi:exonuclease domain-containing protein [Weissella paramesenteroides]|uniref:3'-5' exonuclease n=1 Tax=Weissella paramesenteroides TaxID=1249 RepID=UPI001C1F652F|nr:exonuclease domain-containing protein [Weissella paramesenteroides]MBU7556845.1 hypothetical protein [Weissella paramesenteroides]